MKYHITYEETGANGARLKHYVAR